MQKIWLHSIFYSTYLISTLPLIWLLHFLFFQKEGDGGFNDIVFNAVLFLSFGVIHSVLARNSSKKVISKIIGDEYERMTFTIIAGVHLSFILYFWKPITGVLWNAEGILYWDSNYSLHRMHCNNVYCYEPNRLFIFYRYPKH